MSTEFEERVSERTQTYRKLGQGIQTFQDPPHADIDILAIPGLGTNPVECWSYTPSNKRDGEGARSKATSSTKPASRPDPETKGGFNWLKDPDGLHSMFPSARIMLYDYASAWKGSRKVRATMKSICTVLLDNLTDKRKA
ncbi:hypothetical protein LTR48_005149 [Friedmanniomyces endolithicus]|uniref:Uncharacterized protein n=1 Tax=Rachicladosporium monterosium TaxID=1507873 RepID=A0ABR0L351_9PEZI|nr:hypothetical protein LTR29_006609 [Friedmanniomyces endolithicus]KAK1092023.1 hypothetical protein LTR48_005149 [Friedmanniomyces endolithicus]KAK5142751.1 hypothetical protein LTR32_004968 [Rachicladosporium monterosium]